MDGDWCLGLWINLRPINEGTKKQVPGKSWKFEHKTRDGLLSRPLSNKSKGTNAFMQNYQDA